MANFILLSAILLGTASFVSFTAAGGFGIADFNWASDMCFAAPLACHNPHPMALAAAGLAGLWIVMKFVSALGD
jgi:hypothetical protein